MPAPLSKKTRDAILALVKAGHSARDVEGMLKARGMAASKTTVAELARQFHAGVLKAPERAAAPPPKGKAAPPSPTPAVPEEAPSTPLDPTAVADLDLAQLAKLVRLFDRSIRKATKAGAVKVLPVLLQSRVILAKEIAKLRPVTPPDPASDPANHAARDELRLRLARTLEAAQRSDAALVQLRAHLAKAEEAAAARAPKEEGDAAPGEA